MSISLEIERLQGLKARLRTKLVSLLGVSSSATLSDCVTAVEGINARGAVSKVLDATTNNQEYTVPAGYHSGSGEVSIVLEERRFTANGTYTPTNGKVIGSVIVDVDDSPDLQTKTVTPTTSEQTVVPDSGYDGLAQVTVNAIPSNYADVSDVDLDPEHALSGERFVDADGVLQVGTMDNNGTVTQTINGLTVTSYTIPKGYHSGSGTVSLDNSIETALAAI